MSLSDPRPALAEQSSFTDYLVGLAGVSRAVHALAHDAAPSVNPGPADDFVHALLGLASLGSAVERLAETVEGQYYPQAPPDRAPMRWLR
ncbi:hypothetical protein [Mycolicibacterium sp. HK-90]|uniref:hypothetical protein n=1 Tax=Mycolicibacterium sp. HK-90 TaxID=3056937 RepID=UPI00265ACD6A|nr:hypothetical protein [Mycolicibacterium sp. HK-90]WKG06106.1 hypothetical protein QU592_13975 [Mycolicibacterium sp. HK-90]